MLSTSPQPPESPFRYWAYGLAIASDLELDLLDGGEASPEVRIRFRCDAPPEAGDAALGILQFDLQRILLAYPQVGIVQIAGGERIDVWPAADLDRELLRVFIIGNLMAMLLHQRGRLVIHAGCAVFGGVAAAFAGVSGAGKTSMIGACRRAGLRVLTDDLTAVDLDAARRVEAGYPFIKISLDAAETHGCEPAALGWLHAGEPNKRSWRLPDFSAEPANLGAIFLLEMGEEGEPDLIERLAQSDALIHLLPHTFPTRVVLPGDGVQLGMLARLVRQVPIYRFRRRRGLEHLMDQVGLIEHQLDAMETSPANQA